MIPSPWPRRWDEGPATTMPAFYVDAFVVVLFFFALVIGLGSFIVGP